MRKELSTIATRQIEADEVLYAHGHELSLPLFHTNLHIWGQNHLRVFPWRSTINPYHILIAEMMLRRTQAKQVVAVYNQFIIQYPDPYRLMNAPAEEVIQVLYPLGLAWRAPAFQQVAKVLMTDYGGKIPEHYETLLTLPGVGDYVASAICCFAFNQAIPIIDTNTVRVAGRLFGIPTHAESRRRQPIRQLLLDLLDYKEPRMYNYGMLDFAASVCTPVSPRCEDCPISSQCVTGLSRVKNCL
jgi:A/G-specific adenine glycosylase